MLDMMFPCRTLPEIIRQLEKYTLNEFIYDSICKTKYVDARSMCVPPVDGKLRKLHIISYASKAYQVQ